MALRRIALVIHLRIAAAYVPTTTRARRSVQLSAKNIDFVVEEEARDFLDVSSVFLDSFWADKAGSQELTAAQRRELRSGQLDDFRRRYALRRDTRRKATLFVAKDGPTIIGCAGVELDGAADDANLIPVLSNVATAREGRRRGVATTLVREAEKRVKEWGCTEMDLVVEESNKPARNLYSKLGYSVISKDTASDTLVPTDDGRIAKQTTTTLTMRRDLNGGGAALLPIAGAVVALGGFAYLNLF
jgi:ribosomal protein S18 acetylase RimI-like enzyme